MRGKEMAEIIHHRNLHNSEWIISSSTVASSTFGKRYKVESIVSSGQGVIKAELIEQTFFQWLASSFLHLFSHQYFLAERSIDLLTQNAKPTEADEKTREFAGLHFSEIASQRQPSAFEPVFKEIVQKSPSVDAQECYNLGLKLDLSGNSIEAKSLYEKAAKMGHAAAKHTVALMSDLKTEEEKMKVIRLIKEAAAAGDRYAQYDLNWKNEDFDFHFAKIFFLEEVKKGNPKAASYLAHTLEYGHGKVDEAIDWYKKSAINNKCSLAISSFEKIQLCSPLHRTINSWLRGESDAQEIIKNNYIPCLDKYVEQGLVNAQKFSELLLTCASLLPPYYEDPDEIGVYRKVEDILSLSKKIPFQMSMSRNQNPTRIDCDAHRLMRFLPHVDTISPEILKEIFISKNSAGNAVTHNLSPELLRLEKLPPEMLKDVLMSKDSAGNTLTHITASLPTLLPFLGKLSPEMLKDALTTKNAAGKTPLHYSNNFSLLLPLLKKLPSEMLRDVLIVKDVNGNDPIHTYNTPFKLWPLLENLPPELLKEILASRSSRGMATVVVDSPFFSLGLVPFLKKIPLETFKNLVTSNDSNRPPILQSLPSRYFSELIAELSSSPDKLALFLLNFHPNPDSFEQVFSLCSELPPEALFVLFTAQDSDGRTLLHNFNYKSDIHLALYQYLANRLPDTFDVITSLKDKWGLSALDLYTMMSSMTVSSRWLRQAKTVNQSSVDEQPLSKEAYVARAAKVEEDILSLWKTLHFGIGKAEGQVDLMQFATKKMNNNPTLIAKIPETTEAALKVILSKLKAQTAWLATPRADEPEALHAFYSEDLKNLETIVTYLQKKENPEVTAGYLFRIAAPEKEERCAAGYKVEFGQAAMEIDREEGRVDLSVEGTLRTSLSLALLSMNDVILKQFGGDSHVAAHFQYLTGFSSTPDPLLSEKHKKDLMNMLKDTWDLKSIIVLAAKALKKIDKALLDEWLANQAAPSNPSFLLQTTLLLENDAQKRLERQLLEIRGLSAEQRSEIVNFCTSISGSGLKYGGPLSAKMQDAIKNLSEEERGRLFNPKTEIREMQELFSQHSDLMPTEIGAKRAFREDFAKLYYNNRLLARLKETFNITDSSLLERIMEAKGNFDQRLRTFTNEQEIAFLPEEHGLPSKAIKEMEKRKFLEKFYLPNSEELNVAAVLSLLLKNCGVVE